MVEVGHVLGGVVGAVYGQVLVHSDTRDAAHHVHAKLQAQFVDGGGERAESLAAGSTRETHRVRQLTAVFVENQRRVVVVTMCAGGRVVPVDVDDQRIPAGVFQVFSMNRALASSSSSVRVVPYESQLFQPIGGRHA